jgi:hypothetical protein
MNTRTNMKAGLIAAAASLTAIAGTAMAEDPGYTRTTIEDNLAGTAFVVGGNVAGNPRTELVVSAFGELGFGPQGPIIPDAGTVTLYKNAEPGNAPNGQIVDWETTVIVGEDATITFPNRPQLADINEDGDLDVIVPGGYFFDSFLGQARGSLTWWESKGNATSWIRHDVVTGTPFSYHSAVYDDFNGDAVSDIVTVAEDAGNPQDPADDVVQLQLFAGNGDGTFAAPVVLAAGGGGLIEAYDVDDDGDLDIVSPQYFGAVSGQPFVPVFARDASVASFVWFENLGGGSFAKHAIGVDQGPSFAIVPVENLLGDGVTRWIATNHTNQNIPFPPFVLYPEPAVYEFTPGPDPRQHWSVRTLSAPGDFPVTGSVGQAAPGFANAGQLNDDGRLDIAVSGDGARGVYWMEQLEDGTFITRQLPDSDGYGQSGGPVIDDLNRSGENEIVFGSFDQNAVSIWNR